MTPDPKETARDLPAEEMFNAWGLPESEGMRPITGGFPIDEDYDDWINNDAADYEQGRYDMLEDLEQYDYFD